MYSLLLALIYLAFISLGLPDSLLGSGWPAMHEDLGVPVSYMGIVSMVISGGTIVSSLFSDKLTRKFGARIVTVVRFVVIGFGCGPIYPSIIHAAPDNFGAENSGAIIGIQMASAYVGSTFVPPLFGLLGNLLGFSIMPLYLLVFVVLMIVMTELTFRTAKTRIPQKENETEE